MPPGKSGSSDILGISRVPFAAGMPGLCGSPIALDAIASDDANAKKIACWEAWSGKFYYRAAGMRQKRLLDRIVFLFPCRLPGE
jgi:hypothetical protein